jgi:hypothetical protein
MQTSSNQNPDFINNCIIANKALLNDDIQKGRELLRSIYFEIIKNPEIIDQLEDYVSVSQSFSWMVIIKIFANDIDLMRNIASMGYIISSKGIYDGIKPEKIGKILELFKARIMILHYSIDYLKYPVNSAFMTDDNKKYYSSLSDISYHKDTQKIIMMEMADILTYSEYLNKPLFKMHEVCNGQVSTVFEQWLKEYSSIIKQLPKEEILKEGYSYHHRFYDYIYNIMVIEKEFE